jgi:hypothetical protein
MRNQASNPASALAGILMIKVHMVYRCRIANIAVVLELCVHVRSGSPVHAVAGAAEGPGMVLGGLVMLLLVLMLVLVLVLVLLLLLLLLVLGSRRRRGH